MINSLLALALVVPTQATPLDLERWRAWMLEKHPELVCSRVDPDSRVCVWPGELSLEEVEGGLSFELKVWLDKDDIVGLPGSRTDWPLEVKTDGARSVLIDRGW